MTNTLRTHWFQLASQLTDNLSLIDGLWTEIEKQYSLKIRHYHNLTHIGNMITLSEEIKDSIVNYDDFLLSIWYHDIIYKPSRKDNEEKSAIFAIKRLKTLNIDEKSSKNIKNLIISTKKHDIITNENHDNGFLLDIDLSILGNDWETYNTYLQNIRKEYAIYPNFIYKNARKKVLQHFLKRETLYFTEIFKNKFENQARKNLTKEIKML